MSSCRSIAAPLVSVLTFRSLSAFAFTQLLNTFTRDLMQLPTQTFRDLHAHVEFIRDWFRNDRRLAERGGRRGRSAHAAAGDEGEEEATDEKLAASAAASAATAFLPRVYLLIHNIDGASLRSESQQAVLALLASISSGASDCVGGSHSQRVALGSIGTESLQFRTSRLHDLRALHEGVSLCNTG